MVFIEGFGRERYSGVKVVGLLQEGLKIVLTMTPFHDDVVDEPKP